MRTFIFSLLLILANIVHAAGLNASFSGSRLSGLTKSSTVAEYDGTVDASANLVDISGSNYALQSEDFSTTWAVNAYAAIVTNSVRSPTNTLTADSLKEYGASGGGAGTDVHYVGQNVSFDQNYTYTSSVHVKPLNRTWVYLRHYLVGEDQYCYFNLSGPGTVGTCTSGTTGSVNRGLDNWYRISISKYQTTATGNREVRIGVAEADNDNQFVGSNQVSVYIWGAQSSKNDSYRTGPGVYHSTTSVAKPLHDLTATGGPGIGGSTLQAPSGRLLPSRTFNGSSQYYSKADHENFNIFDNDFTITMVFTPTTATPIANSSLFAHYISYKGIYINLSSSKIIRVDFYKGPLGSDYVSCSGPTRSLYNNSTSIIQLVRRSNIALTFVDGASGSPVNVSGYGVDVAISASLMYMGGTYSGGNLSYVRIDAEALSTPQLDKERQIITGVLASSGNTSPDLLVSRSTTASTTFSNNTIGYTAVNVPRVNSDGGGLLAEGQRTNLALQSQAFGTTWSSVALTSISSDGAAAPDTNTTADGFVGTAVDTLHGVTQAVTLTAASYTLSVFAKIGNKNWIYVSDDTVANAYSYFNVNSCSTGTAGAGATLARATQFANGWCRCSFVVTGTAAAHTIKIASANADTDNDFAGDAATVNTWFWGAQVEAGAYPSSYMGTTTTSVTRSADVITTEPWRISKNTIVDNPMAVLYFDNDVYNTSIYTSEVGNYSFTVNGDTKHIESQTLNDYFSFDGTGDYLSLANASGGSAFNLNSYGPNASFSVVAIITPNTVSGTRYIVSKGSSAPNIGWGVRQVNATVSAYTCVDGSSVVNNATGNVLISGKTSLLTVTYTYSGYGSVNTHTIYADSNSPTTSAVMPGPIYSNDAEFGIASSAGGSTNFLGNIHYLAFYKGTVITQAQHNAMYASLKEANILPVKMGNSYEHKKLYVNFDSKCSFASSSELGGSGTMNILTIGSNTGTADSDNNRFELYVDGSNGRYYVSFFGNTDTTNHYGYSAVFTNLNTWKTHKIYYDFSNMANNSYKVDSVEATWTNNSGTENFDLTDTLMRFGQNYAGAISNNYGCRIRNLTIRSAP